MKDAPLIFSGDGVAPPSLRKDVELWNHIPFRCKFMIVINFKAG